MATRLDIRSFFGGRPSLTAGNSKREKEVKPHNMLHDENVKQDRILKDVIPHLFLTKRTPSVQQSNLEEIDFFLVSSFSSSVQHALEQVPLPELEAAKLMLEKWLEIQPRPGEMAQRAELFQQQVSSLENGQTLAVYIRNQNATLLITKREESIELATYRSSLPSKMVMSIVGSHSLSFPETREIIQRVDILASEEFATQIQEMSIGDIDISLAKKVKGGQEYNETRDVADPRLVTDWIVGLLVSENPSNDSKANNLQIRKTIRDQVTFSSRSSRDFPFRRSGMLMSLKVALQLKLIESLDNNVELGKYVYKLMMLRVFTDIADKFLKEAHSTVNLDLGCQILAKIGIRVQKLSNFPLGSMIIPEAIINLKDTSLTHTESVIAALNFKMQNTWKVICSGKKEFQQFTSLSPLSPTTRKIPNSVKNAAIGEKLEPCRDLEHEMLKLDEFIKFLSNSVTENKASNKGIDPQPVKRYLSLASIKSGYSSYGYNGSRDSEQRIWLFDAENYIKFVCSPDKDPASTIYQILIKYASQALETYEKDPLGMSQLVLVTLKGLQMLDQIATTEFPQLLEYRLQVNTTILDNLLLPYKKDMELVDELVKYFKTRNVHGSFDESGILGRNVNHCFFGVRYAMQNENMKALRDKILADTELGIKNKYEELERCRKECHQLQERINASIAICECQYKYSGRRKQYRRKIFTCSGCDLRDTLRSKKTSVGRYERPLPQQEVFQWAVVFELHAPEVFALWRGFLAFFKFEILGETIFNGASNNLSQKWCDYNKMNSYKTSSIHSTNLNFGSQSHPSSYTYYSSQSLDVTTTQNESFIIYNGMGCNFQYKAEKPLKDLRQICAFSLESVEGSNPYLNLQNTLLSTTHTQNSIIARQYECHESLSTREFIAYGSLRAGHRIQLRNLYEAIYSGDISLQEESVMALILQTIWEVGPRNELDQRESHLDFENHEFAEQFIDMLDNLVKTNAANYSSAMILVTAVLITRRIAELNDKLNNKIHKVLQQWREILESWTNKILGELENIKTNVYKGKVTSLKQNLQEVLLCSLLSYNISDSSDLDKVMVEEKDIVHWLKTIYLFNTELKQQHFGLSTFSKNLLRFAKLLPLRLNLEEKMVTGTQNTVFRKSLNTFICQIWNRGQHAVIEKIQFSKPAEKCCVVVVEYKEISSESKDIACHRLTFDFVQGMFLVNGHSESELPYRIQEDKLFKRYFKNASNLRVRQENENLTTTVLKYRGRHYEFHQSKSKTQVVRQKAYSPPYCWSRSNTTYYDSDSDSDGYGYRDYYDDVSYRGGSYSYIDEVTTLTIVIKEKQDDGSKLVLLDPSCFTSILSSFFVANYSHWLDMANNRVLFRPEKPNAQDQISPEDYIMQEYKKGDKTFWKLYDVQTKEHFLNIRSDGFQKAKTSLARLELPEFINVTMNQHNEQTAFLRRHNLKFRLKENGHHESVEYPEFTVTAKQQAKGTLIGLQHGLLLQNKIRQILLVPHSSINIEANHPHQIVSITLQNLKHPSSFVYEFDDVLKRLKAHNSKSAWLYLAALHASTSSPLPDPFTRVTGTEMCVGILQSACVWSCSPYDPESKDILKYIKELVPKRKYYGPRSKNKSTGEEEGSMETVEWPEAIYTMAAYEGLAIIVDKLIEDSERLAVLHGLENRKEEKPKEFSEKLLIRSYSRYLSYYSTIAAVEQPKYFCASHLSLMTRSGNVELLPIRQSSEKINLANLLIVATTRLGQGNVHPLKESSLLQKNSLTPFIIQFSPIDGSFPEICLKDFGSFRDILYLDIRYNWLRLYKMAISCTTQEKVNAFTILLSIVAYRGAPMEQVANLHCISQHVKYGTAFPGLSELATVTSPQRTLRVNFDLMHDPFRREGYNEERFTEYSNPTENDYDTRNITEILKASPKPFTELEKPTKPSWSYIHSFSSGSNSYEEYKKLLEEYEEKLKEYQTREAAYLSNVRSRCGELSQKIKSMIWPCEKVNSPEVKELLESYQIESWKVIPVINQLLAIWYRHYKLTQFISKVQSKLNIIIDLIQSQSLETIQVPKLPERFTEIKKENEKHKAIKMEDLLNVPLGSLHAESIEIFESGKFTGMDSCSGDLVTKRQCVQQKINEITADILKMITGNIYGKVINQTPLACRLSPRNTFKYLTETPENCTAELLAKRKIISDYAGALAVLRTLIKQLNRCIRATTPSELERETANHGHSNWSPSQFPEWLLLELELDIMIRPVQVDVAKQMITMPDGGNGVTQLNMGEGKTSVIVPMLCSTLAKKDEQLCRVTVLSSMFNMNLSSLTFAIGGLLNRRVYSLPCRRDLLVDENCVAAMDKAYKECLNLQGVVLTLPEHRLSFRLLAYDKILKKEVSLGLKMLDIENWLRKYARDVLDESDELLSVKYQLVYTIGEHLPIDGGDLRWATCQRLLEIVQRLGASLVQSHGSSVWEFEDDTTKPHEFLPIRLLSTTHLEQFLGMVADQVLEEVTISEEERQVVKNFLLKQEMDLGEHLSVMQAIFKETPNVLPKIMVYSGYLKRGILGLALTKRWRVEYGVETKRGFRRMAVPFRAKDVAAEKTEFGHPDLAIILTHLSYYYSGLNEAQMKETFEVLKDKQVPEAIYSSWIASIPQKMTPQHLKEYKSLNLKDAGQKKELFEILHKHKMVVDFWLANCVFPRESKQFPGKLVMTAWDLLYERQKFVCTGFSGTNDSQILLPLNTKQQDLEALQHTNRNMESTLLQPENGNHQGLRMGVTCKEVLEFMKNGSLGVLIDAGALMLELSNRQVADLWLVVNPEIEAVVYFSQENNLMVKSRVDPGEGTAFDVSPYQGRLEKCGVFLDDQHTRGTDLKFPLGSKACVTIGARMKRDKLIQACMRMRKLGQGHCVTFYLSHEAHDKIGNEQITTKSVLDWVCKNTREFNEDGLLYWALAGRNYAQRLAAEDNFHYPCHKLPSQVNAAAGLDYVVKAGILANQCVDDEVIKLVDMYGQFTQVELLTDLIPKWFAYAKVKLMQKNGGGEIAGEILNHFQEICTKVRQRCLETVPRKQHVSSGMMEEEQEKELELEKETEVEEQRQVERPRQANAVTPCLDSYIESVVLTGEPIQIVSGRVVRLSDAFRGTSYWSMVQPECWGGQVFASNDFVSVIQEGFYSKTDDHLRPIQYMVSSKSGQILVLSPFEVNELIPRFRRGETQCILHMFSLRRTENQDLLVNVPKLQLPVAKEDGVKIMENSGETAALLLASGGLYFNSLDEQAAYLRFLNLAPQPWSLEDKEAHRKRMITRSGFLLPQGRRLPLMGFQRDPIELIKKILGCRHPVVSEFTHVMRILEKKRKIDFPEV